jgi:hypothetical protein
MKIRSFGIAAGVLVMWASLSTPAAAQAPVPLVGMGDSIGEGVQSADASEAMQGFSFISLIGWQMGTDLSLPFIRTNFFGAVGNTDGRTRLNATTRTRNLAVSGADAASILRDAATALTPAEIDTETELVLYPETGSQIEIAERLRPEVVVCWIGNNDALGAALAFDQLNATQLTPIAAFTADFTELVQRLDAVGAQAVFGTIPDITGIGFLLNRSEVIRFLGSDHGLPEGHLTSVPAVFFVKLGLLGADTFSNPDFVLDPAEQAIISNHVAALNTVIRTTVASHGMALVDTHAIFQFLSLGPLDLFGRTLTTRFLGGIFSLDGVHPSNTGHALATLFFIDALNQHYGLGIPQLNGGLLQWLVQNDPHIDHDRDGRVRGRLGQGLLETLMWLVGLSGDTAESTLAFTESATASTTAPGAKTTAGATEAATRALDEYARRTGKDLRTLAPKEQRAAMRELFGIRR